MQRHLFKTVLKVIQERFLLQQLTYEIRTQNTKRATH